MRPLTLRTGTTMLTWLQVVTWLSPPCFSAKTPRPIRPTARDQHGLQFRGNGEDLSGFILFITLAVILAVAHFTSRWLVSAFPVRRPAVAGSIAGALIGLIAALSMNQFMGWPWIPSWKSSFPDCLCLLFGIVFGRRSAVEESKRPRNPVQQNNALNQLSTNRNSGTDDCV